VALTDRDREAAIERHPVDLDRARHWVDRLPAVIDAELAAALSSLDACPALGSSARDYAGYLSVVEPNSDRVCWSLRLALQAQASIFDGVLATLARRHQVEIELDRRRAVVNASVDEGFVNVADWTHAFFLACVCRDSACVKALSKVPVDLLRQSPTRAPDYWHLFAEAMRALLTPEADFHGKALAAAQATKPEDPNVSDHALYIGGPATDLLCRLMNALPGSPEGPAGVDRFNRSLAIALDYHRRYWFREEDHRLRDPNGYLALPILALASIAYDSDVPIEVESEYIPRTLIEGACRRSPPTSAIPLP